MYEEILAKHASHESVDLVRLGAALQGEATWTGVLVFATSLLAASAACVVFGLLHHIVAQVWYERAESRESRGAREEEAVLRAAPRVRDAEVPAHQALRAASYEGFTRLRRRARAESSRAAEGATPAWPDLVEAQGLGPSLLVALRRRDVEEAAGPPQDPPSEGAPTEVS